MYNFRETTPFKGYEDNEYPAEAMLIDGQLIEDLIPGYSTLQVGGRELLSQSIEKQTIGKSDGELIQYVSNPSREIVVGYRIAAADNLSFRQAFYKLNSILHGDSHKVSFKDDPSKYWVVTLSDIDEVPKGRNEITSSFTLFVPDGVSHSLATQTADNTPYKDVPVNLLTGTGNHTVTGTNAEGYLSNESADDFLTLFKGLEGQTVTVSVDYEFSGFIAKSSNDCLGWETQIFADTTKYFGAWYWPSNNSGSGRVSLTFVVPKNITRLGYASGYIRFSDSGTGTLSHLKLEKGSKATPWSPNPADHEYHSDTITVDYQGTYPAYPIITATMKSENGLVAFANDKGGVLQFGNPDEVDTVTKQKSDKVINYGMRPGQTGFTQNVGPVTYTTYVNNKLPNKIQGSVTFDGENAYPHYTSDNGVYWHGPSLHGAIPANSNGENTGAFIWKNRFDFDTDVTSLGRLEFTLTSGDKPVLTYTMRDSLGSRNQIVSQFWGAGLDKSIEMNPKIFGNGFYEIAISRDKNGGLFTLSKVKALSGDTVVAGSTYKKAFNNDTFQTMPIDGMTVWFQKFSNKKVVNMDWTDSKFTWVNVPYIEDVPNRFDTGDVVTVDVANRKIYVNDVLDNTLQTVGNQWESFALQPGTTTIQPVVSSWATMYDCKLTYREAWL